MRLEAAACRHEQGRLGPAVAQRSHGESREPEDGALAQAAAAAADQLQLDLAALEDDEGVAPLGLFEWALAPGCKGDRAGDQSVCGRSKGASASPEKVMISITCPASIRMTSSANSRCSDSPGLRA
jgi:hypothetical protein